VPSAAAGVSIRKVSTVVYWIFNQKPLAHIASGFDFVKLKPVTLFPVRPTP